MYTSSQDAIEDNACITVETARRELARHNCRIIAVCDAVSSVMITVTNDCDEPEAIPCRTGDILMWLGY